jgi:hypothetical protein
MNISTESGSNPPLALLLPRFRTPRVVRRLPLALVLFVFAIGVRAQTYVWTTLAGNSGYGSVNSLSTNASFHLPGSVVADSSHNVYVADSANHLIRKISSDMAPNRVTI